MLKHTAALGFRVHSGWAALVALAGPVCEPVLIRRCRIELASTKVPGSKQPYHTAKTLPPNEAAAYLEQCRAATVRLGTEALQEVLRKLNGYKIQAACILLASGRPLPDVERILASHALIHTAEGEFYRSALRESCESCGLTASSIKERDVPAQASLVLNRPVDDLNHAVTAFAKHLGPPWQQDHKLAALAAWHLLARPA